MVGRWLSISVYACTAKCTPSDAVTIIPPPHGAWKASVRRAGGGRSSQVVDRASHPAQLGRMETRLVVGADDRQELGWPGHQTPTRGRDVVPPARLGPRRQVWVDRIHESHAAYPQPRQ